MTQKETIVLMSYIYNLRAHSENQLRQLQSNIRYSKVDVVDCSELASAIVRDNTIHEITANILILLNLDKDSE